MRAEIVNHKGVVVGMTTFKKGTEHIEVSHELEGYGLQWRVRTFWGRTLATGQCRTIKGDTVHLNLRGVSIP